TFLKNRWIRLFPPMLLCTVITFIVFITLDTAVIFPDSHDPRNFLPSLTFITPKIWTLLLHKNFAWTNGSYWTLWNEVQFYVLASLLFFLGAKEKFLQNLLV